MGQEVAFLGAGESRRGVYEYTPLLFRAYFRWLTPPGGSGEAGKTTSATSSAHCPPALQPPGLGFEARLVSQPACHHPLLLPLSSHRLFLLTWPAQPPKLTYSGKHDWIYDLWLQFAPSFRPHCTQVGCCCRALVYLGPLPDASLSRQVLQIESSPKGLHRVLLPD